MLSKKCALVPLTERPFAFRPCTLSYYQYKTTIFDETGPEVRYQYDQISKALTHLHWVSPPLAFPNFPFPFDNTYLCHHSV